MCVCVCVCVKVDDLNTYNGFTGNISFFILLTTTLVWKISVNKERNITSKPVVSVSFIHFPNISII